MSNKCAKCTKSVFLPEERKACGKVYHIDCFTCGGANTDGCKKKLTLDAYSEHDKEPYCKTCYGKLFGPKGFYAGSATFNSFVENPSDLDKVDLKNDRNTKAIEHEDLPQGGGVAAAMANLKKALPGNA